MYGDWIKLLNYWQRNLFRHALSFSFIVGALKEFSESKSSEEDDTKEIIRKLINEMRSHQGDDYYHHIYRCPDIDVLVVTRLNGMFPPSNAILIENKQIGLAPSLYVSDGVANGSSFPIQELVESIFNESGEAIEEGNYSRNGKQFGVFSEYDKKAIAKALA